MKILLLSHKFYPAVGGIETISEILANEFVEAGHQVRIVTWSEDESKTIFPYKIIRRPNLITLFKQIFWATIVFENNPCIRLSWPAFIINKPTVIALHTWIARSNGKSSILDKLKLQKLKTAKNVIAISKAIQIGTFKKAIIISNPFKVEMFKIINKGVKENDFVFLGRLVSDKGVDIAIEAIYKLNHEGNNFKLTIIGDGPEKNKLKKQVLDLKLSDNIHFLGNLTGETLVNELCKYKYILIPSRWKEPFGVVALEGIACGCIPIVADGGGLPDAVGNAGIIFKRGDTNDLVKKINNLLGDLKLQEKLKEAADTHLLEHNPKLIAKRYLEILAASC